VPSAEPTLSIVTVALNAAREIERTFASVAAQRGIDLQYIVIDGGSTDGTADLLRKYEPLIDIAVSERDRGIYDAMNKGLRAATGKWIVFLNAGDTFHDEHCAASVLRADDNVGLAYGDVVLESPGGSRRTLRYPNLSWRFLHRNTICHQAIFARRSVFDRTGEFDLSYRACADFDWLMHAHSLGMRSLRLGAPTAVFRLDGLTSKTYVMRERFAVLRSRMPTHVFATLGGLDFARRLVGDDPTKRVLPWLAELIARK